MPLTETYTITVFYGSERDYSISTSTGHVCFNNSKYIESAVKGFYNNHLMLGKLSELKEEKVAKMFSEAGVTNSFLNYENPEIVFDNSIDSFKSYLASHKWDAPEDKTWIIIPKPSKHLTGKKISIEFNVGNLNFDYGNSTTMELDVYMTAITKTSKSVTFAVKAPKFLYDKCMTDPDVDRRPKKDYCQNESLAYLHAYIQELAQQAFSIKQMEKEARTAKKIICINFSSSEQLTRDDYNHAYTGQKIGIHFNFFVAYKTTDNGSRNMFTYKKYKTGFGTTDKGINGIINTELQGSQNWLGTTPQVIIEWTQEREDFLLGIENNFRKLSENLNHFLKDLDEDKIKSLMENSQFTKLLN